MEYCFEMYGKPKGDYDWFRFGYLTSNELKQVIEYEFLKKLREHARNTNYCIFAIGLNNRVYNNHVINKHKGLLLIDWDNITIQELNNDLSLVKKYYKGNYILLSNKENTSYHFIGCDLVSLGSIKKCIRSLKYVDKKFRRMGLRNGNYTIRISNIKYGNYSKYNVIASTKDCYLNDIIRAFIDGIEQQTNYTKEELEIIEKNIFSKPEPNIDYTVLTKFENNIQN